MERTRIAGHRGASALVPHENSLEAFACTAEVGAGWVELDVRQLRDGTLVAFHDATCQGRKLHDLDLTTLRQLAGFRVPTLASALTFCRGHLKVDIELKEVGTEAAVAAMAQDLLPPGSYVYTSFHDSLVAGLKALDPAAPAGLLLGRHKPRRTLATRVSEIFPERRLEACRADFVAPNWRLVQLGLLQRMAREGWPVWVWTVNHPVLMARFLRAGVAAIVTDHPDRAVTLRRQIQGPDAISNGFRRDLDSDNVPDGSLAADLLLDEALSA